MEFQSFVEWAFLGIVSGGVIITTQILQGIKKSVDELNLKIAVILEKTAVHEKELSKLDQRINILEIKLDKLRGE